jgi:hypothetical protein
MTRRLCLMVSVLGVLWLGTLSAAAQDDYTETTVTRVILLRAFPGKFDDLMNDLSTNFKPVWEDEKKQNIIENYSVFYNTTKNSPTDWNIGFVITFKNHAAFDGLSAKTDPITLKHYGTKEARKAASQKRFANAEVVSISTLQDVTLK